MGGWVWEGRFLILLCTECRFLSPVLHRGLVHPPPAVGDMPILDPNTPRSPKHQAAEQLMTTGKTAQVGSLGGQDRARRTLLRGEAVWQHSGGRPARLPTAADPLLRLPSPQPTGRC